VPGSGKVFSSRGASARGHSSRESGRGQVLAGGMPRVGRPVAPRDVPRRRVGARAGAEPVRWRRPRARGCSSGAGSSCRLGARGRRTERKETEGKIISRRRCRLRQSQRSSALVRFF
jgi:hypothetical protein